MFSRKNTCRFIIAGFIALLISVSQYAQGPATTGFAADYSDIYERLNEKKSANPKIKPEELTAFANELLAQKGLNYEFEFDQKICQTVAERRKKIKPGQSDKVGGKFSLQPKTGDATNIFIPNIPTTPCGSCFATMPVVAADETEFIVLIQKRNIGFRRTDGLFLNEIALLDNKDTGKTVRRWTIPSRLTPLGISADGLRFYLPLPSKNFDELVLVVFENGIVEFIRRADAELNDKPVEVKINDAGFKILSFGADEKKRILRFAADCKR